MEPRWFLRLVDFRRHDHVLTLLGLRTQRLRPSSSKPAQHQKHGNFLEYLSDFIEENVKYFALDIVLYTHYGFEGYLGFSQ